jgi:hypothetical protein
MIDPLFIRSGIFFLNSQKKTEGLFKNMIFLNQTKQAIQR